MRLQNYMRTSVNGIPRLVSFNVGLEKGISEENFAETIRRLSVLQKRRGDFDEAIRLWEEAADNGHIYAFVELAKYYEHKKRDLKSALKWTKSAKTDGKIGSTDLYPKALDGGIGLSPPEAGNEKGEK